MRRRLALAALLLAPAALRADPVLAPEPLAYTRLPDAKQEARAQALMQTGDHTSPAAMDMARRFRALTRPFMTDDPEALAKYRAVWADALKDDATAAKLTPNRQILAFVERAMAHLKAQEAQ